MTKYIHYCWFGGKPLSSLTKKCIKSWKKYLPDFEIKRWDESNCDLNECKFVKEAYENKKWAFVADYFRAKILKEYGGIYFDTDMEITKNIDELLKDDSFLGVEDSGNIAVGVWWEKNKNALLPNKLYEFYNNLDGFDKDNLYSISIPKLVTNELIKYDYDLSKINEIQNINGIIIYPRDYFYPLSYDRQDNIYTDNTCMIHYYDATWIPKWEKKEIKLIRMFGREKTQKILKVIIKVKKIIKTIIKICFYPLVYLRRIILENIKIKKRRNTFLNNLKNIKDNSVIAIHNEEWLGTTYATKELFEITLSLPELLKRENYKFIAEKIVEKKPKIIIFSALARTWCKIILEIKELDNSIPIKVIWHGSNAMHIEDYDYEVFTKMFDLLEKNKINSIGFVKKSMYDLYKKLGYNVEFIYNKVTINNELISKVKNKKENNLSTKTKIGLYASGDRWVKNFYNQLAGASLIENSILDIVPLSEKTLKLAKLLKCEVKGEVGNIPRERLLERLSNNDINIYATFVDCAPITPLESLELGVPCITGNNHHYWENTELEKYLVVDKVDNAMEIAKKIELCLKNKEKILKLYEDWKKENNKLSKKSVDKFIETK